MGRKTRIRTVSVPKEDNFWCSNCKATGACDDKESAPFFYDEAQEEIVCRKCKNLLGKEEELNDKLRIKEIQVYGFWLRFASSHFNPCGKCQDKLHISLFEKSGTWYICDKNFAVNLTVFGGKCYFSFRWLEKAMYFTPCKDCDKKLRTIIRRSELHIYNDVKPVIELWRVWDHLEEIDDETKTLINNLDE